MTYCMNLLKKSLVPLALFFATEGLVGCSREATPKSVAQNGQKGAANPHEHGEHHEGDGHSDHAKAGGHSHDGWWCNEHGVPEEVCALCNSKVAAEFQKKRDWCQEHDRPDSQCFLCHPELEAKFAAQYEAKFGKKPPRPSAH